MTTEKKIQLELTDTNTNTPKTTHTPHSKGERSVQIKPHLPALPVSEDAAMTFDNEH